MAIEEVPPEDALIRFADSAGMPQLGPVIEQVRGLVETYHKPMLIEVEDPQTGTRAPAALTTAGIVPVPVSVFEDYLEAPRYRRGTAKLTSLASFTDHVNRFKGANSAVFANDSRESPSLTAVLDYHAAGASNEAHPDFGRHRSTFSFPLSDEWKAWTEADGQKMTMADFAVFLEDHSINVLDGLPELADLNDDLRRMVVLAGGTSSIATALKLVELSRGLRVNENAVVREAVNLSSGEGEVTFQSENQDEAGQRLRVPTLFLLALPIFKNGPHYRVAARLRYRARGGVTFWFDLWRIDRAFDHAFTEACLTVGAETGLPLFLGAPE